MPVGFSQELRDGVAKSFKVRSKDYFQNLHAINYNKSKLAKQSLFVSMPWLDKIELFAENLEVTFSPSFVCNKVRKMLALF